jgi:hypothetical protein
MATDLPDLKALSDQVSLLTEHCKKLRDGQSIIVPITTLEPEPYELVKEIMAVVQPDGDDSFVATYFDGNINASGNTQVDAIANLKDMMIALYETLEKEPKLGRGPARQLAILRGLMRRKG